MKCSMKHIKYINYVLSRNFRSAFNKMFRNKYFITIKVENYDFVLNGLLFLAIGLIKFRIASCFIVMNIYKRSIMGTEWLKRCSTQ